jgi:hypothetical protein
LQDVVSNGNLVPTRWVHILKTREEENVHYKGLRYGPVYQRDSTFEVPVDGAEYVDALEFGEESGGPDDERLSPKDAIAFRSCAGCVGYVAPGFRPDVAVECSILGRTFMNPTNWDMRKVDNVLEYIQKEQYAMRFRKGAKLLSVFCGSAGPNERGTQGSRVFALTDEKTEEVACCMYWESRNVKRTCRQLDVVRPCFRFFTCVDAGDTLLFSGATSASPAGLPAREESQKERELVGQRAYLLLTLRSGQALGPQQPWPDTSTYRRVDRRTSGPATRHETHVFDRTHRWLSRAKIK